MKLPIIRPATVDDLDSFMSFATDSGSGITSLPHNKAVLEKKLQSSEQSFRQHIEAPEQETYLFCMEWEGQTIGISGIISRIGTLEPFFAYHLLYETQNCSYLGINKKIPVLHFTKARKKPTEIGTLFLSKQFRNKEFGKLLSFSRFLFIACFKQRFASTVIAELRGVNHNGTSPFWEAVGRYFFQMDFSRADYLRTEQHACIEELIPKYPLYVELLPKEAQQVIGSTHPETTPAKKLLEKQGFKLSHYLDIFDAGPHVYAHTDEIGAVKMSQEALISEVRSEMNNGLLSIISNTRMDYRATLAPIVIENNRAVLHPHVALSLQVDIGDSIRYYHLI